MGRKAAENMEGGEDGEAAEEKPEEEDGTWYFHLRHTSRERP